MAEFQGAVPTTGATDVGSGDVKYHLGTTLYREYGKEKTPIKITLLANPSHLEAVNPVVIGRARAEQHFLTENKADSVVPIVIHGDAAFAAQGVVYECIQMAHLPDYSVGGTIHVIVNNQIGFTTSPFQGRSGYYCSDLAKTVFAPIFHVNADCLEDVARVFEIAAEYRQKFNNDVVIDLIGYRKMGHNELDQPSFTQPLMYNIIKNMQPVRNKYRQQLLTEGIAEQDILTIEAAADKENEDCYVKSKDHQFTHEQWSSEQWEKIKDPQLYGKFKDTGVEINELRNIGEKICHLPEDKKFHAQI